MQCPKIITRTSQTPVQKREQEQYQNSEKTLVENPLSKKILGGEIKEGDTLIIDSKNHDNIEFKIKNKDV